MSWEDLTQEQYIDNLVRCKTKLDELKWTYNLWPKENKTPKPTFSEIVNPELIRYSILENLKMEAVLLDTFNFEVTPEMLQHDLDRMASNTKDPKRLKELFAVLNNDSMSIVQCVSKPYLVLNKLGSQYSFNNTVHTKIKFKAINELYQYHNSSNSKEMGITSYYLTYKLVEEVTKAEPSQIINDELLFEVNIEEFNKKVNLVSKPYLKEEDTAFVYYEILEKTNSILRLKSLIWPKVSLQDWLKTLNSTYHISLPKQSDYRIPKINNSHTHIEPKSNLKDTWVTSVSVDAPPSAREFHTAVWTGSEMIIWGGYDPYYFNTGGRYDPATDSWKNTKISGAPSARYLHTAVWTGTEMIIWGGSGSGANYSNVGGRYNPNTNSWQSIIITGAPSPRVEHTAIWDGTQMIIFGGKGQSNNLLNDGGLYDPLNNSWQNINTDGAPSPRSGHTSIWSGSEMIIWGGYDGSSTYSNTGGRYNPNNHSWQVTSLLSAPVGRINHSAVWTSTEMIIWGGKGSSILNNGGRYNPKTDSWTPTNLSPDTPNARQWHSAIWSGDEMIIFGGYGNTGSRYNPVNDSWQSTSFDNAPSGRLRHTAIWTGDEMIVWGGTYNGKLNTGGRYNPDNDSWQNTSTNGAPSQRIEYSSTWTGNELIIWGGYSIDNYFNNGGRFNPVTNTWIGLNSDNEPSGRRLHSAIWTGIEMIIWGGYYRGNYLDTGGRYNPNYDTWSSTSNSVTPSGRSQFTSIWTGDEMIIWGGENGARLNSGGKYNPTSDSWQSISSINAPSARTGHFSFWSGNEMIVWGGFNNGYLNSGGRYNPVNNIWQSINTSNSPISRSADNAVWAENEMIVWGGYNGKNYSNSGSRYNPQTDAWQSISSIGAPIGRHAHSSVWTGRQMIIWGGSNENGNLNTGGLYDPISDDWQTTNIIGAPSARQSHTAVWSNNSMIIWGGNISQQDFSSVGIYYPYATYSIGVSLSGLNGNQLILQNNGGDDLTLNADGLFEFGTEIIEGSDYEVTVLKNPQTPDQTCTVMNGSGSNIMSDVNNIEVVCVNNEFNVGATVTGLALGNSVELLNNGTDFLEIAINNVLTYFGNQVQNGMDYAVTVETQPTSPNQICTVSGGANGDGTGTIVSQDVTDIWVSCVTIQYDINIAVSGLAQGNSISFSNGNDSIVFNSNTTDTISTQEDGTAFDVSITSSQPVSPNQICSFTSPENGSLNGTDVAISVECLTTQYTVGGSLTGLEVGNSLVAQNNLTDDLTLSKNGDFSFNTPIYDLNQYSVSVFTQPITPNQTCIVSQGTGTVNGNNIEDIDIVCTINTYFLGGNVSGLMYGNDLLLNNGDNFKLIDQNGPYIFNTPIPDESDYDVQVYLQPSAPIQPCQVINGASTISGNDVTNIDVICNLGNDLIYRNGFNE